MPPAIPSVRTVSFVIDYLFSNDNIHALSASGIIQGD
jgi:hypothetical protein